MSEATQDMCVLTDSDFHAVIDQSDVPVVVDFWSPWCLPCRFMTPILEDKARQYEGRILFGKLDVQQNPQIAGEYQVSAVPTLIVFKNGQPAGKMVGLTTPTEVESWLDQVAA